MVEVFFVVAGATLWLRIGWAIAVWMMTSEGNVKRSDLLIVGCIAPIWPLVAATFAVQRWLTEDDPDKVVYPKRRP